MAKSKSRKLADFISDSAIDTAELADGSISTAKIADDAVSPAKLDSTGAYTVSDLTVSSSVGIGTSSPSSYYASDYEVEKEEAVRYTSMVCQGIWPDYKNSKPSCNN
jgi:hypothetical protein